MVRKVRSLDDPKDPQTGNLFVAPCPFASGGLHLIVRSGYR
jgi:hypothetical protein